MDKKQDSFKTFSVPDPVRIEKVVSFIRKKFNNIEKLRILECGIAKGGVTDILSKEGAECYGIDIHPRSLEGVKTIVKDLNEGFPIIDKKFDIIFAGEVMEHLFDDEKFIEEAVKLIKKDGFLIITVPNLVFSFNRFLMFFGKMPKFAYEPYHYHMYNKKVLANLMESKGLKVKKIISSHVLFSTRRNKIGIVFEILGNWFPSLGAHLIIFAQN